MFRSGFSSEGGSAILEFILFVVLGQMLVFAGSLEISALLASKIELQILATNSAKVSALNQELLLPADVQMVRNACSPELVCLTLRSGSLSVSAVGLR